MKKIRKQNTKFRNNAVNKFISLALLVSIPISLSGCTENEDFHVINKNVNLIRNKDNQFEFNIAFYNLNNLLIDITREGDFAACFNCDDNQILINYDYAINYGKLENTLSHECFHLLFNKCIDCLPFYHNGCAIDAVCTEESPLIHTFLIELVTEDFSFEAFYETPNALYDDERDKLNLICKATDKDVDYFKNAVVTSDSNYIMTAFEMEFRSVNYVYSIFNSLDKVCGYGYFDKNWDYDLFKSACFNYAKIGLLKNAYVKIIKQYKMNLISIEDVNYKIDEIKSLFNNSSCDYEIDDNYLECVKKLDEILRKAM